MIALEDDGSAVLNEQGAAFNHDFVQLIDKDARAAHGEDGAIDGELAQIYDGLRAREYTPLNALQYLFDNELAQMSAREGIEQTEKTDAVAQALQDFGAIA